MNRFPKASGNVSSATNVIKAGGGIVYGVLIVAAAADVSYGITDGTNVLLSGVLKANASSLYLPFPGGLAVPTQITLTLNGVGAQGAVVFS